MRYFLLLILSLCTISCLYPGLPFPAQLSPTLPNDFYPCSVGSRWVYEYPGVAGVDTYIATGASDIDGAKYVTIMKEEGKLIPSEEIKISLQGIYRVGTCGKKDEYPRCLLKLPAKTGEKWENATSGREYPPLIKGRNEVMTNKGWELVVVPAGIYWAIRIDCFDPFEAPVTLCGVPFSDESTTWFAPGVGIVKFKVQGNVTENVLKSFTPGKNRMQD